MLVIEFQAKHPYTTWGLEISRDFHTNLDSPIVKFERDRAEEIMAAFETAGWEIERIEPDSDWPSWSAFKPGTGLFQEWLPEEAKRNMAEARKILRKFGLTKVTKRRLELADLL